MPYSSLLDSAIATDRPRRYIMYRTTVAPAARQLCGHLIVPRSCTPSLPYSSTYVAVRCFSSTTFRPSNIPFNVSGTGNGKAQSIPVKGSPHIIIVDAFPSFGGADSAPSPLAYNISSLGSCTQVTGSLVAKDRGIKLGT